MLRSNNISCSNCRRKSDDIRVTEYSRTLLKGKHSKVFYALPPMSNEQVNLRRREGDDAVKVWLCSHCDRYLLEGSNDACDYWPAMIYKFLVHQNSETAVSVSMEEKWKLIPTSWRSWWEEEFEWFGLDVAGDALFVDLTKERQNVLNAISELKWLYLAEQMDAHFAFPEVCLHMTRLFISWYRTFSHCLYYQSRFDVPSAVQNSCTRQTLYR